MGKPTGFLEYKRETARVLPPKVRIANFNEFRTPLSKEKQKTQGARCMACGVPFCQSGMNSQWEVLQRLLPMELQEIHGIWNMCRVARPAVPVLL